MKLINTGASAASMHRPYYMEKDHRNMVNPHMHGHALHIGAGPWPERFSGCTVARVVATQIEYEGFKYHEFN